MTENTDTTPLHIDRFKNDCGDYVDNQGVEHEDAIAFYTESFFGFCGCGVTGGALKHIRDGLRVVDFPFQEIEKGRKFDEYYPEKLALEKEVFGSDAKTYFFYLWADKEGLIEHGGSVPGWLSSTGREVLEDLNRLDFSDID